MAELIVTNANGDSVNVDVAIGNQITLVVDKGNYGPSGYSGQSGYSGYSGYSGASGYSSYSGYSGISGFSGYSGTSGYSGSGVSGYSGFSGSGTSGYSGFSGYSGQSGASTSGYSGFSGASGFSGISGFSGSGISGYSGYSGSGLSGFSGASGFSGQSGASTSGYSGFSGFSGYSGSGISGYSGYSGSGISGYSGYSGAVGATGASGFSGFSGTGTSGYSGYSGYSGVPGVGGAIGNYGSFFDTTDQPISVINTPQAITINSTYGANGVSIASGSRITIDNVGTYQLTMTVSISNLANSVEDATFWIKLNGSDYPNSATSISLMPRKNVGEPSEQTETIIFTGTSTSSGDYVQVYWSGSSTDLSLNHHAAGTSPITPVSPSLIVSLIQVMYTQSGYSGYSGASGLSGYSGATGANASTYIGSTPPVSPIAGELWWDDAAGKLKIYYVDANSSQWVDSITGSVGASGASGYSGLSGYSGIGISGYSGYSGLGISGYSGFSGYSGAAGSGGGTSVPVGGGVVYTATAQLVQIGAQYWQLQNSNIAYNATYHDLTTLPKSCYNYATSANSYNFPSFLSTNGVLPRWNGSKWLVINASPTVTNQLSSSTDGITWTVSSTGINSSLTPASLYYANGTYFAIQNSSASFATSTDGITWTYYATGGPNTNQAQSFFKSEIFWTGSQYVFAYQGASTGLGVWTSPTGVTWTNTGSGAISDCAYNGSLFIATSNVAGTCRTSPDGTTWTNRAIGTSTDLFYSIRTDGTNFLAIGSSGAVWKTTDGISWTQVGQFTIGQINLTNNANLYYFDGNFYATGNWSLMKSSDVGATWTQIANLGFVGFFTYNGSYFLSTGITQVGNFTSIASLNYAQKITSFSGTPPNIYVPIIVGTQGTSQFYMRTL